MKTTRPLLGIFDILRHLARNEVPTYFVSPTHFNLMGVDEWVRNFRFVNYIDCFDGAHPNVFSPPRRRDDVFHSVEEINNHLLEHPDVERYVRARGPGRAAFLMFDERTEELCERLGLEICFPSAALRESIDNKIETTRIGDEAGVPSVPNVMAKVDGYERLRELADEAGLGERLVVQAAFGDSGHTTWFVSSRDDYEEHADEIEREDEVKIMKRIRPRGSALEACVTRHGTIVAPLLTELVGFPELTPDKGGWCGNEVFGGAYPAELRAKARKYTFDFGAALYRRGYRGYFEVDYLLDEESGELYLGEVNPRVTGASSMTNLSSLGHPPLFLFHLLEFSGVDYELDVEAINERFANPDNIDSWSQLIVKQTHDSIERIDRAPPTGIWTLGADGSFDFLRAQTHRHNVDSESEGFWLRISGPGDYGYEGADLGILITPGRLMTDDFELEERAKDWIRGIRSQIESTPVPTEDPGAGKLREFQSFKIF